MEYFKLPIFREKPYKEKRLTMDEYLRFVVYNLKHTINMPMSKKFKKEFVVGKKFVFIK